MYLLSVCIWRIKYYYYYYYYYYYCDSKGLAIDALSAYLLLFVTI